MLLKLAWRNLWRQKRRTILTASALALALALSLFMRCLQEGTYANNIENAARFYTGLIQIQHPEFSESQSIDDLLPASNAFITPVRNHRNINQILPRIESFALAAAGEKSKGVMVLGVAPEKEDAYSGIANKVSSGEFLRADDDQLLIGEGLAKFFGLEVGGELILYGMGYRGQTAAGLYTIKGLLDFPMPQLDNQLVYMPLALAQSLYSTEQQVTSWVLHTKDLAELPQTVTDLTREYGGQAQVRDWEDLSPEMSQQIVMDKVSGIIMMYLLYGVVGFGLFATLLMMTLERQREFGVMLATGLLRRKLILLICIESLFIAIIGVVIGLLVATPVLIWFYYNPITLTGEVAEMILEMGWEPVMPVMLAPWLFIDQVVTVLVLLALCMLYPIWRIYRLDLVSALKGGGYAG
ncbi:ABC-type transport system, involved in lipoprotein release, permease component [Photobacterium marinum]|uniref:ABC-type transport system, involved in lipoprotein release, permease component n=1 Tax=Photobacterium marinum TaxID=1056511 RepID=L8JBK8_9GAMM|nr:FtsX-like permease family protein [Photobacterium marinum]ELR64949.1 ABC-type transport system, involved in lipoprotein release, permease component [Photobacterium marinum]